MLHGPHFTDGTAWFPLHVAIHSELMDAVMSAVQESRVHERLPEHSGGVPLHLAASTGHTALLRLLLDSHADVNASDDFEDEPLHAAAWAGSVDICQLLLQHGAAVNAPGHADETPLEIAILRGHTDVEQLLRGHGGTLAGGDPSMPCATPQPSRKLPPGLPERWAAKARRMPPLMQALLVHGERPEDLGPPQSVTRSLLLELGVGNTLESYRGSWRSAASEQVLCARRALSVGACAVLRHAVDCCGSSRFDSVDGLPNHDLELDEAKLRALLGADATASLLALPQRAVDAVCGTQNDTVAPGLSSGLVRRYAAFSAQDQPFTSFHLDSASVTVNVALTDEAELAGGRLLGIFGGRVQTIVRGEGDAVVHSSALQHGVTALASGSRYTLILFFG
jgi:hypothetical protein